MNNIAGALYRVIRIKNEKRNEVQPENEVSVTPVSVGHSARAWQPTNNQRRHDTAYLNKRLFY